LENVDETHLSPATYEVSEGAAEGTVIGSVGYFEPGTEQFPYFETTQIDQNDEAFLRGVELINAGVLDFSSESFDIVLSSSDPLDFEEFTTFKLKVALCCYTAGNEPTETITVRVTNVNELTSIADQTFSIDENSEAGMVVGTIVAEDEDGDDLTFSILSGNVNDAFALDGPSGQLTVNNGAALDFEVIQVFNLEVMVEDGKGASATATISVSLNDLDDEVVLNETISEQIMLFPNPVRNQLTITFSPSFTGTTLSVFDLSGKEMDTQLIAYDRINLDMSSYPVGIYLIKIGAEVFRISKE
ncbi:MAG: cadherin domain-containing protein, partial [Marinoscillum sp.]